MHFGNKGVNASSSSLLLWARRSIGKQDVPKRLAIRLGLTHHRCMNAYSEDLRKKVVEAKECGMPTVEVARTFGMGISSVKRYAKTAREGGSLRPKKSPGRPPKADERARRLLEADLQERPAATLSERREYLSSVAG